MEFSYKECSVDQDDGLGKILSPPTSPTMVSPCMPHVLLKRESLGPLRTFPIMWLLICLHQEMELYKVTLRTFYHAG